MEYGFLNLSLSALVKIVLKMPVLGWLLTRRFIAGKTIESGFSRAEKLRKKGYKVILFYLGGEHLTDLKEIRNAFCAYTDILNKMIQNRLNYDIAVKLSQFGLFLEDNESFYIAFFQKFKNFVRRAELNNVLVWVDAEELKFREKTFEILSHLHYNNLGVCVQACANDSVDFLEKNLNPNVAVRICKGAYKEDKNRIITNKNKLKEQFISLMWHCIGKKVPRIQVATHDKYLIDKAKGLRNVEIAVLVGRDKTFADLVYIPFGPKRADYIARRVREKLSCLLMPFKK